MLMQHDFPVLRDQIHRPYIPSIGTRFAIALGIVGACIVLALPEDGSNKEAEIASSVANVPETAADDSLCDKQAWPYIDQRCAQRVELTRGTRQVRVVTDKGN